MTGMSDIINGAAAVAREQAREKTTGQFGKQHHSDPELAIDAGPRVLAATGPAVPVAYLFEDGDYNRYSLAEAKKKLGIPAAESAEVVAATLKLMGEGQDSPSYISDEPGYELPGEGGLLDTSEWYCPVGGVTWHGHAEAWEVGDGQVVVRVNAVLAPDDWGFDGKRIALQSMISDHMGEDAEWADWGTDLTYAGGCLHIPVTAQFAADEFQHDVVADTLGRRLTELNPYMHTQTIRHDGIVISDEDINKARELDGRPFAYAAKAAGRVPSDAEIIAICDAFDIDTTLRHGYLDTRKKEFASDVADEDFNSVTPALNAWYTNRKK